MSTLAFMDRANAFRERLRKAFLSDPAWKRIGLTRKRRRHWKRQYYRPWKNLPHEPPHPVIRIARSTALYDNLP